METAGDQVLGVMCDMSDEIAHYAPWRNLAIFYRDFGCSRRLVRLDSLDRVPEAVRAAAPVFVTVEAARVRLCLWEAR